MPAMTQPAPLSVARNRAAVMEELRRLLPGGMEELRNPLPFGLAALDSHLPQGGLARGALHEVVPAGSRRHPGRPRLHRGDSGPSLPPSPTRGEGSSSSCRPCGFANTAGRMAMASTALGLDPAPPDPGRDGAPQTDPVGHGGGVAVGGAASRRRHDRQARSENQPEAASRRHGCGPAAFVCCGRRTRWKRARRRRAGASARRKPRATASASSRAHDGICSLNAVATDGRANG